MAAAILAISDDLESRIRDFLTINSDGGKFILPTFGTEFLAIPLMIALFEEEEWTVSYDFNEKEEWLIFEKSTPFLLGYDDRCPD